MHPVAVPEETGSKGQSAAGVDSGFARSPAVTVGLKKRAGARAPALSVVERKMDTSKIKKQLRSKT